MRPHLPVLATATLLTLGCATAGLSPAGDDVARELRSRGLDPATVVVPHEITDEMRDWARAQVPEGAAAEDRLDVLLAAMVDPERLHLTYEPGQTATAAEAFAARKANCLAFTSLFVGMARALGTPAFYVAVDDVERFEKDGDLMVISGHVSAGYDAGTGGTLKILDFTPDEQPGYRRVHRLSDLTAIALYHSNRGAELLRAGRLDEAMPWLRKAVEIDPELGGAWVNLGVALRRGGDVQAAEAAYHQALEADPSTVAAYQNLASLLRARGRDQEAEELLALAARLSSRNPFSYLALGDISLAHGRTVEARRFYQRALRLDREDAEAYAALGEAALAAGNPEEARKWLRKASARDQANERVRTLGTRLAARAAVR